MTSTAVIDDIAEPRPASDGARESLAGLGRAGARRVLRALEPRRSWLGRARGARRARFSADWPGLVEGL